MELQVGVKAFIKNSDNKYLLLKRVGKTEKDAHWTIPGGRINTEYGWFSKEEIKKLHHDEYLTEILDLLVS